MKEAAWMAGASVLSWLAVSAVGGERVNPESVYGMAGPLIASCVSWIGVRHVHRAAPERVMGAMIVGFAVKFVFFGAYVAVVLRLLALRPLPFMAVFVSYFIALYAMQALFLRRLVLPVK